MAKSRDTILKELGFSTYDDYLKSSLWGDIRDRVSYVKGFGCSCCNRERQAFHHTDYREDNLSGTDAGIHRGVWPICNRCHKKVHIGKQGRKRTTREYNAVFFSMMSHQMVMLHPSPAPSMSRHQAKVARLADKLRRKRSMLMVAKRKKERSDANWAKATGSSF